MLQTVRDACKLQPNALDVRVGDQIERLDQLIAQEGMGRDFFAKTHVTEGLDALMRGAVGRLAGHSSQAIFHLKQAMGGGKTHLLVALGLIAKHPELRLDVCGPLHMQHLDAFGTARVAAFDGRNEPVLLG